VHHSLTSGEIGRWLMGLAALVGGAACLVYIVRGARRRDRRSLTGAAIALPLLVIAVNSIDMNQADEVLKPVV
jgi:hypothetical protein